MCPPPTRLFPLLRPQLRMGCSRRLACPIHLRSCFNQRCSRNALQEWAAGHQAVHVGAQEKVNRHHWSSSWSNLQIWWALHRFPLVV